MIFTEAIRDHDAITAYAQKAIPTMMQAGGKLLVADDGPETLEGEWHGNRTVVLEFESVDAARGWYRSPEYQVVIPLRQAAADGNAVIVSGFEMPAS